jgi:hypothetical protein
MSSDELFIWTIFLLGVVAGSVVTSFWINVSNRWRKATGQLKAPEKARQEAQAKVQSARKEYAQGWRELRRALWQFFLLLLFLLVCFVVLSNYLAPT